jgi:MATE family multidrug resistance protein
MRFAVARRGYRPRPMSHAAFRPTRDDVRATLRLALPIVAVQVGQSLMPVVDNIMVGHFSGEAMASVALGNIYSMCLLLIAMGVLLGLDPVVSQAVGAGDDAGAARATRRGMVLAALLTIPVAVVHWPAAAVLRALGQHETILGTAQDYCRGSIVGLAPFLFVTVMRQSLQARHRVRPILIAIVLANLLNAALDWALIFGHLGAPAMGAVGSGWATAISRWFLALLIAALAWPDLRSTFVPWTRDAFDVAAMRRVVAIGLPIGVQVGLEMAAFNVTGLLIGRMGDEQLAGHTAALSLASLTFMVPLGVGIAASVLVGNAIGRGDSPSARRAAGAGFLCGVGFMAASALTLVALPRLLAQAYTDVDAVVVVAASLIPIAGVFQVFDGAQVVASGILRGAGETRVPAAANLVGYWVVGIPIGWALATGAGLGPRGLWWGLTFGLVAVAALLSWRVVHALRGEVRRTTIESPTGA